VSLAVLLDDGTIYVGTRKKNASYYVVNIKKIGGTLFDVPPRSRNGKTMLFFRPCITRS
jgi:hypothetical protein